MPFALVLLVGKLILCLMCSINVKKKDWMVYKFGLRSSFGLCVLVEIATLHNWGRKTGIAADSSIDCIVVQWPLI
jgi:hypothetical protein